MRAAHPSALHRLVAIGIGVLAAAASLAVAAPASAHDSLDEARSTPAPGSSIAALPEEITLAFSAALLTMGPQDTVVDVLAPSGEDISEGDAVVDGAMVRQQVGEAPQAGVYTVNWHVVSSDGHPTEGTYSFTVETASRGEGVAPQNDETATAPPEKKVTTPTPSTTSPAPSHAATPAPSAAAGQDDDAEGSQLGQLLPWILLGLTGIAILIAVIAVIASRRRGDADDDAATGSEPSEPR